MSDAPQAGAVTTGSWWLKVDRAVQHLHVIDEMLTTYEDARPYRAERARQPRGQRAVWRYVLTITEQPDPMLAAVVGDYVHNLRSALDHVAVALAPRKRKRSAGFPIEHRPIWATNPDGAYVLDDDKARTAFDSRIEGIDPRARALIEEMQPYGNDPETVRLHPLRVLSRLENADKHTSLLVLGTGLLNPTATATARGESVPLFVGGFVDDGDALADFTPRVPDLAESEVVVTVQGMVDVVVRIGADAGGRGDPDRGNYSLTVMAQAMLRFVVDALVDLDPLVAGVVPRYPQTS